MKSNKKRKLEFLFDEQMNRLTSRGCPKRLVSKFARSRESVVARALELRIDPKNIPFLPVIPDNLLTQEKLMNMIENDGKRGEIQGRPEVFENMKAKTSSIIYWIFDIDDGRATSGKKFEKVEKTVKSKKRSFLTFAEIAALCLHTRILASCYVIAERSSFRDIDARVLFLIGTYSKEAMKRYANRPALSWHPLNEGARIPKNLVFPSRGTSLAF